MNAKEKGSALLRLRGAGATVESIRQMADIYGEDDTLLPNYFVTQKFESAKAITAFGGYALFKGLMTDELIYASRDVFGAEYLNIDYTLSPVAFKAQIDALEALQIQEASEKVALENTLGVTIGNAVTSVNKAIGKIKPSDMAVASEVTKHNMRLAISTLQSLLGESNLQVFLKAKELETV